MCERNLVVDHTTIYRWVQKFAPEIPKRSRPHLMQTNDSWRVDETYIKVRGQWMYLNRAVDSTSQTFDFLLNQTRCARAAPRFFRKVLARSNVSVMRVINVDKNRCYIGAVKGQKAEKLLPEYCKQRASKYMNNLVEQDHRFIKRRVSPRLGFGSFQTAWRTLQGYETINMIRKGQIAGVEKRNIKAQNRFIDNLFEPTG